MKTKEQVFDKAVEIENEGASDSILFDYANE